MAVSRIRKRLGAWLELLRWHKPSGRLILLIPALWSLWLTRMAPPPGSLVALIVVGGLAVSGAGCIANDLWDRRIDPLVERTKTRPMADGRVGTAEAAGLLVLSLVASLAVVLNLPAPHRLLCLELATAALLPVLLYPSAKRWFAYPQLVLALCWGFAVLIPWAAATGSLGGSWPLALTWLAVMGWTFGFDTVYAMADRDDDRLVGIHSSALSLGEWAPLAVRLSYAFTAISLAAAAALAGVNALFWPLWLVAAAGMQREALALQAPHLPRSHFGGHFNRQVLLGGLLLLALVVGRAG